VRLACATALLLAAGLAAPATVDPGRASASEWAVAARLAPQRLLLDVAQSGERLLAVGERGHILVSSDSGASWTQAKVPTRALLTGVYMHDGQLAWAVGHDAVVLRTRDGGSSWQRVHHDPEAERPLLDVWFADAERGLATSAYGELLVTGDGGDSWHKHAIREDDDFHLNQIAAAKDGTLYIAAEAGHLYRSDDGGETWLALTSPYEGSFFGVLPLEEGPVLAFGLRGRLFVSQDRGRSWTRIETATEATLLSAVQIGPGRFVVAGMEGTLVWGEIASTPAVRTDVRPDRQAIVAFAHGKDGGLLLVGEGGVRRVEVPR
jgi:photosystem II stability/assembly factor-like uncharacterized protein